MDIRIEEIYTFHLIHHDRMRDGYDLMQPDLRLYQSVLKKKRFFMLRFPASAIIL